MAKRLMIAYRGTVKEFKEYFKRIYIDPNQKSADRRTLKQFKKDFKAIYTDPNQKSADNQHLGFYTDPNQKIADGPYIEITRDFTVFKDKFEDKSLEIIVKTSPYISLN